MGVIAVLSAKKQVFIRFLCGELDRQAGHPSVLRRAVRPMSGVSPLVDPEARIRNIPGLGF
jgi:hypothetical protein